MSQGVRVEERAGGAAAVCVYCREPLEAEPARCGACGVEVHAECAAELPRCPTIGCRGGWGRTARAAWQRVPVRAAEDRGLVGALVWLGLTLRGLAPLALFPLLAVVLGGLALTLVHVAQTAGEDAPPSAELEAAEEAGEALVQALRQGDRAQLEEDWGPPPPKLARVLDVARDLQRDQVRVLADRRAEVRMSFRIGGEARRYRLRVVLEWSGQSWRVVDAQ